MDNLKKTIKTVVKNVEQEVDAELERLDNLKLDDIETMRANRLAAYRKELKQHEDWRKMGHGSYDELGNERDFFEACKKSENVVVHFYLDSSEYCKIVDYHLQIICKKQLECRFTKINASRCPFLTERFQVVSMPTILLVKNNKCIDKIVGLSSFGNREDFSTDMMRWRLAVGGVIKTHMDLTSPPDHKRHNYRLRRSIRDNGGSDSSD